ncbi:transaldolase [Maribacter chungangensis]|uniref:Transaldolase n=1 Tax=Maribacter chungangensis TaxID=1069117 RepID=A0ABW3B2N4_9FLAO
MKRFLPLVIILIAVSCNTTPKKNHVLFAGEIVNPSSDYVVLLKGTEVIDSAKLDEANRFTFKLNSVDDGLYHFNHAPEFQYVYLEKGDSLLMRLNTLYFDESLVFSGSSEAINNFLLELFLSDEAEEETIRKEYYNLESDEFTKKINQLKNEKLQSIASIKEESKLSEKAFRIAKASVDYTYYRYMEMYPFEHKRKQRDHGLHEMDRSFYEYRKNIDYNDKELNYLRPYYDFMKSHLGNISFMTCKKACNDVSTATRNQLHFNKHKLHVIDSLVVEKELRDNLFRNVAFDYLLKEHDSPENNKIFLEDFVTVSGNNMHIAEIEHLYEGIRNIQPNSPIPSIAVLSSTDESITLPEIGKNKKTVFYFWSAANKTHYRNIFKRIHKLSVSKPEFDFVGINFHTDKASWKGIVESAGLDIAKQFRAVNFEEANRKLVIYPMNKCIITNDTLIVDAFSNIYANF